jgi:hypothetical protein
MDSHDKKKLEDLIEADIKRETGIMACVTIIKNKTSKVPYETIHILHIPQNGESYEKEIHLSHDTIYDNNWHDIADRIIDHLGVQRVRV